MFHLVSALSTSGCDSPAASLRGPLKMVAQFNPLFGWLNHVFITATWMIWMCFLLKNGSVLFSDPNPCDPQTTSALGW